MSSFRSCSGRSHLSNFVSKRLGQVVAASIQYVSGVVASTGLKIHQGRQASMSLRIHSLVGKLDASPSTKVLSHRLPISWWNPRGGGCQVTEGERCQGTGYLDAAPNDFQCADHFSIQRPQPPSHDLVAVRGADPGNNQRDWLSQPSSDS